MVIYKRRKYLIKRAFQLKYTAMVLLFIFLTAAISSVIIYLSIFPYLSEKLANVYPQGRLVSVLRDANFKILISLVFLLPLAAWFGIMLSHRIAGPWYRLENILRGIKAGDFVSEVRLREHDELKSLADAINEVIIHYRSLGHENLTQLKLLDEIFQAFKEELDRQPLDLMKAKLLLSKMQDTASDLKALITKYRLLPQQSPAINQSQSA